MPEFSRTKNILGEVSFHRPASETPAERDSDVDSTEYTTLFLGFGLVVLAGTAILATWRDWTDAQYNAEGGEPVHSRPMSLYNFKELLAFTQQEKLQRELARSSALHEKHIQELERQLQKLSCTNVELLSALKQLEKKLMESVSVREESQKRLSKARALLEKVCFDGEEKPWVTNVSAALDLLRRETRELIK